MKTNTNIRIIALVLAVTLPLHAAEYAWDVSSDAGVQNGSGIWNASNSNISARVSDGTTPGVWSNNVADALWFGGNASTAGSPDGDFTVTVEGSVTAGTIRQIAGGTGAFTLTGGSISLDSIRTDRGTFTINSSLISANGSTSTIFSANNTTTVLGGNNSGLSVPIYLSGAGNLTGAATLRLNHAMALGTSQSLILNWGSSSTGSFTLDVNGNSFTNANGNLKNVTVNSLNNSFSFILANYGSQDSEWGGNINLGSRAISIIGNDAGKMEISGNISATNVIISSGTAVLSGTNTHTGGTAIQAGATLQLGSSGALGAGNNDDASMTYTNNGATLDLNGQAIQNEQFRFNAASGHLVNTSANTASWGGNIVIRSNNTGSLIGGTGNITISGVIKNEGAATLSYGWTKIGNGTVTLTGNNTYTGSTTVSEGTLVINGNNTGGGTFSSFANTIVRGTGLIKSSAVNLAGDLAGGLTFEAVDSSSTLIAGGSIFFNVTNDQAEVLFLTGYGDQTVDFSGATIDVSGTLSEGTRILLITSNNGIAYTGLTYDANGSILAGLNLTSALAGSWLEFDNGSIYLNIAAIPELSTFGLLVGGAFLLVVLFQRKRKSATR